MKTFIAVFLGLTSGLFLYVAAGMVGPGGGASPMLIPVALLGGWVVSTVAVRVRAPSVKAIMARAFLLWTADWVLLAIGSLAFAHARGVEIAAKFGDGADTAGAIAGSEHFAMKLSGVALLMGVVCALSYYVMMQSKGSLAAERAGAVSA